MSSPASGASQAVASADIVYSELNGESRTDNRLTLTSAPIAAMMAASSGGHMTADAERELRNLKETVELIK